MRDCTERSAVKNSQGCRQVQFSAACVFNSPLRHQDWVTVACYKSLEQGLQILQFVQTLSKEYCKSLACSLYGILIVNSLEQSLHALIICTLSQWAFAYVELAYVLCNIK